MCARYGLARTISEKSTGSINQKTLCTIERACTTHIIPTQSFPGFSFKVTWRCSDYLFASETEMHRLLRARRMEICCQETRKRRQGTNPGWKHPPETLCTDLPIHLCVSFIKRHNEKKETGRRKEGGKKLTERNKKVLPREASRVAHATFSRGVAKFNRAVVSVDELRLGIWIQVACCRLPRAGRGPNIEKTLVAAR